MKLTDVKLPKKTKSELKDECPSIGYEERDRWPYGLQIRFEKEQITKMPEVAKLKVGDTVSVSGTGKVISVRMSERRGGQDDHSVEIQIEQVGVSSKKKLQDMDNKEYRKARDEGQER